MLIADVIRTVLGNLPVLFFIMALAAVIAKIRRAGLGRRPIPSTTIVWTELTFYYVGLTMIWAGIFHAYFQSIAAPQIGWQPSPFEYELGWFEIGLGVAALFSRRYGNGYRAAITVPFVIFSLAAAAQHLDEILKLHNYAPANAGIVVLWFGDIFVPLLIGAAALMSRHERA